MFSKVFVATPDLPHVIWNIAFISEKSRVHIEERRTEAGMDRCKKINSNSNKWWSFYTGEKPLHWMSYEHCNQICFYKSASPISPWWTFGVLGCLGIPTLANPFDIKFRSAWVPKHHGEHHALQFFFFLVFIAHAFPLH